MAPDKEATGVTTKEGAAGGMVGDGPEHRQYMAVALGKECTEQTVISLEGLGGGGPVSMEPDDGVWCMGNGVMSSTVSVEEGACTGEEGNRQDAKTA